MKLKADTLEEIHMLSVLCQDSITTKSWISYEEESLHFLLNRFCWEREENYRIRSALTFLHVQSFLTNRRKFEGFVSLLSFALVEDTEIIFYFDDNLLFKAEVSELDCRLEDISDPWVTDKRPKHDYRGL